MAGNISLLFLFFFYNKCRRFDLNLNYLRTITQKESRWTSTGTKLPNEPHRSGQPELPFNYEINLPLYQFNRTQNLNSNVINSDNKRAKLHNVKATFPSLTIEPNKLKEIRKCWCTGVTNQKKTNKQTNQKERKRGGSRMEKKINPDSKWRTTKKNYQVLENHRAQHSPRTAANCSSIYKFLSLLIYSMCPSIMWSAFCIGF